MRRPSQSRSLFVEPLEQRCLLSYQITDLGTLGGSESAAVALNGLGHAAGHSTTGGNPELHAFLYADDTIADLGTLGGRAITTGLNNADLVVGYSEVSAKCLAWLSLPGRRDD